MGREGWIYALAFLAVLAAGAAVIGPRLVRLHRGAGAEGDREAGGARRPPRLEEVRPRTPAAWVRVEVRGPRGPLLGPLKTVEGAEVERDGPADGPVARLRLRPRDARIAIGASGHGWRVLDAATLTPDETHVVVLPRAAPSVVVRVREPDGRPAPDVPVSLLPTRPGPPPVTDAGGTLVVDDAAPGLLVVQVGGRVRRGPTLRLRAGGDQDVVAVLEPAWEVTGRAVDASGRALARVRVEGFDAAGPLGSCTGPDAAGRFVWRGPVVAALALRVTAPGVASTTVEVAPPDRAPLRTDAGDVVVSDPVVSLSGRVLGAASAPNARVSVEPAVAAILRELFGAEAVLYAPHVAPLEEGGAFRLTDLPGGLPLRVSVRGAGLPLDDVTTPEPGARLDREYTPDAGQTLHGQVRDAVLGRPASGVRLRVSTRPTEIDASLPGDREVLTDGTGHFRLTGLPRGSVFVRAYVPGRRALLEEIVLPRRAAADLVLAAEAPSAASRLEGVVVDDTNEPLDAVLVRAGGRTVRTGPDGHFRLEGVEGFGETVTLRGGYEPGVETPEADPTPYVAGLQRSVDPAAGPVKLVLARAARLRFRALDGLDDVPLAFLHLVLRTDEGQVLVDRPAAPTNGEVRLEGLPPAGGTLTLLSRRHRLVVPVMLEAGGETDLGTLRLARGMHITGRVVDPEGKGIPGARLGAVETGWLHARGADPTMDRELALRHTVTGPDGRFVLDGCDPQRPAVLAVWAPGFAPAARRVVLEKFRDDVRTSLTVKLQRGGYLAVELVESASERPVTGALFDLEDARNGSDYLDLLHRGMLGGPVASREDWRRASAHFLFEQSGEGRYRLGPIEPGPYEVWVDRPGYRALRRRLTILDPADALVSVRDGASRSLTEALFLQWEMEPGP